MLILVSLIAFQGVLSRANQAPVNGNGFNVHEQTSTPFAVCIDDSDCWKLDQERYKYACFTVNKADIIWIPLYPIKSQFSTIFFYWLKLSIPNYFLFQFICYPWKDDSEVEPKDRIDLCRKDKDCRDNKRCYRHPRKRLVSKGLCLEEVNNHTLILYM